MINPLSLLTGNPWVYAGVLAIGVAIGGGATYQVTAAFKNNTIKDLKLEAANKTVTDAVAALAQFEGDTKAISSAAALLGNAQGVLDTKFSAINKDFANAIKAHPLPIDCKPDDVRMRTLRAAVEAANSARTVGQSAIPAVPNSP
jgi:hypothetical protein